MIKISLAIGTLSMLMLSATPRPDNGCTGMGTTAAIALICSGTCASGECTSFGDGLDEKGPFSYCGCQSGDIDTCCTVVLRDGIARARGTCPPCGATGLCDIQDNLPDGNLNEPVCNPVARRAREAAWR
jgi:hypothetical protein